MNKITITIEEIKANPNLDLSERINKLSEDNKYTLEELGDLAVASIKNEYEYWANNRTNISERTNKSLQKILDGHILSKSEEFEMICDDPIKNAEYSKYESLKQKISDNNGITSEDFDELCNSIGFDLKTSEFMKEIFKIKGLIIDSYEKNKMEHR